MITEHQYLAKYPIRPDSKKLIVGTIHPHNHQDSRVPFYYGNRGSLWAILAKAFPGELTDPTSLASILRFLESRKISVSDTIKRCTRKNPTALDKDLLPIELNTGLLQEIRNSEIAEILFTSGFSANNAFRLFYVDMLNRKIRKDVRQNRGLLLENEVFGRPVKLTILYSPSGSSNVGISKSKLYLSQRDLYIQSEKPVLDFKVDYYRKMFE